MDERKARDFLQKLIDGCGRTIRDVESRCGARPDQPPIDVEWFRVMRAKARGCLQALDAGDQEEFHALISDIAVAMDAPLWPSMASALGLRPSDDWLADDAGPASNPSPPQQTLIHFDELAKGWVYVRAENPPADAARLPHILNDAICRWLKQNPTLRVRTTLPIVAGGNTVAIHVFFD